MPRREPFGWKITGGRWFVTWRRFGERELIVWRRRRDGAEHGLVLWPLRVGARRD